MYDLGDTVRLAATVRDAAGAAVNATTVTLTVTLPDGTTAAPAVTNPPAVTGSYFGDYVTTQAGRHTWRLVTTGPVTAYQDVLNVREEGSRALVSLEATKKHLNISPTNLTNDDELREHIETVTPVVESYVGTIAKRTVAETYSGRGRPQLVLREWPALSITSVTEHGQLVAAAGYALGDDGVLTRVSGYYPLNWLEGWNNISIVYVIGRLVVAPQWQEAAKELARVNFRPQLGGNYSPFSGGPGDDQGAPSAGERRLGFYVPNRVLQLLATTPRPPGMA